MKEKEIIEMIKQGYCVKYDSISNRFYVDTHLEGWHPVSVVLSCSLVILVVLFI